MQFPIKRKNSFWWCENDYFYFSPHHADLGFFRPYIFSRLMSKRSKKKINTQKKTEDFKRKLLWQLFAAVICVQFSIFSFLFWVSENSEKEKSLSEKYFNCDADFFVVNKHIRIDTPKLFIFKQIQLFVCKIGACHMFFQHQFYKKFWQQK